MARLAATQPQGSQASTGLKRKAPASKPKLSTDVDESFNAHASFDLPADTSHDERPTKKARSKAVKTSAKKIPAPKVKARPTKTTKQPKPARKAVSKPAARLQQDAVSTIAATRQRRTANTTTYEESSGSDVAEAPTMLESAAPKEKVDRQKSTAKHGPATASVRQARSSDEQHAQEEGQTGDEDVAQDSYPLANPAALSAESTSFGTQLHSMVQEIGRDKENIPPQTRTPFGDKTRFVDSVNAMKSATPKKTQTPVSETRAKKMSVIHFGPGGPANQGVSSHDQVPAIVSGPTMEHADAEAHAPNPEIAALVAMNTTDYDFTLCQGYRCPGS